MKMNIEWLLGLYSEAVALRHKQVTEAARDVSFLTAESFFWLEEAVKKDNPESIYNECAHWDVKLDDARLVLEICKRDLFVQILQESFWPSYGLLLVVMVVWLQW